MTKIYAVIKVDRDGLYTTRDAVYHCADVSLAIKTTKTLNIENQFKGVYYEITEITVE